MTTSRSFSGAALLIATVVALVLSIVTALLQVPAGVAKATTFSPYVDKNGGIRLPTDYRSNWAHLGTWAVQDTMGVVGFHEVYTQPSSVEAYKKTGEFPDGAVLIKELRKTNAAPLTTGQATWSTEITGWFIMIKDTKGRFKDHSLWGDGWGWALFYVTAEDPQKLVTQNYKSDCVSCHIPARQTDWVYIQGYPELKGSKKP